MVCMFDKRQRRGDDHVQFSSSFCAFCSSCFATRHSLYFHLRNELTNESMPVGHPDHHFPQSLFTPRPMPPPSPQHYQQRYHQPPPPLHPQINGTQSNGRQQSLPPIQNRPGSSMSISSMLGSDPERGIRDGPPPQPPPMPYFSTHHSSHPSIMSPPQHPSRPSIGEYQYKPRSQTPDHLGFGNSLGTRPHRSSSGTMTQKPGPFDPREYQPLSRTQGFRFPEVLPNGRQDSFGKEQEQQERVRRVSLSGVLQRPSSQPQHVEQGPRPQLSPPYQHNPRPSWSDPPSTTAIPFHIHQNSPGDEVRPVFGPEPRPSGGSPPIMQTAPARRYDTHPPGTSTSFPTQMLNQVRDHQPVQYPMSRPTLSASPELRRTGPEISPERRFGSILNHQPSSNPFHNDSPAISHDMTKQDSTQSQSERSIFGERLDKTRGRLFSPFAVSSDDQIRKGSDESQHKGILNLQAESRKNGRGSPMPQAVQGAQVGPDPAIKTEPARVFSGLGGASATPTPSFAQPGLSPSPFRRDEGPREEVMKGARGGTIINKRSRKTKDDTNRDDDSLTNPRAVKKSRHHHHHHHINKIDNDEPLQRRASPLSTLNNIRRVSTPTVSGAQSIHRHHHHHHHHHHHRNDATSQSATLKPSTTIKISHILQEAAKTPRRHLGTYLYSPKITIPEPHQPSHTRLNISIKPSMLPSFKDHADFNCTYTVRVSRTWLQHSEREAICMERFLWGSGIYSDDSDPIAAAVHSGYIKGAWNENVDITLLEQIIAEQNPQIDGGNEHVPDIPAEPPANRDLHITLLVLPRLERYVSTARYGIKSRSWPEEEGEAPHDGVSFLVLNCEWVDEGDERGKDRTGAARRSRIDSSLGSPQPPKVGRAKRNARAALKKQAMVTAAA